MVSCGAGSVRVDCQCVSVGFVSMFDTVMVDELRAATASPDDAQPELSSPEDLMLSCAVAANAASTAAAFTAADAVRVDVLTTATLQLEAARRSLDAAEARTLSPAP